METKRFPLVCHLLQLLVPGVRNLTLSSAVLDLPAFSSEADIRDRYRALSLIFHPDRQRDHNERKKEIATARFLEIQFAYEGTMNIVSTSLITNV